MTKFANALIASLAVVVVSTPAMSMDYGSNSSASSGYVTSSPDGMSLYVFDKDQPGISNCYDDCATEWPPMLASRHSRPHASFGIIVRKDGALQWAIGSHPLYYFDEDKKPGDVKGDGYSPDWHLAMSAW